MRIREPLVNASLRLLLRILCRINTAEFGKLPPEGPAILLTNHTTNIEGPLYYVFIQPRRATALGKEELWHNPVTRFFMETWDVIPVHRGRVDREAMAASLRALERGLYLGIAPEGTRSKSGKLGRGQAGAAYLATQAKVPLYPMVQWGLRDLGRNLKRLRRTDVTIRIGPPFYLTKRGGGEITTRERKQMVDEMMYQLAVLLPNELRGHYQDLSNMTTDFVHYA
jgi:1-acyl-sn-glycerol-3-phosphate acyltransferase